jgi:predicted AlkP superfamily phosphohydrolase/phosphomutase
MSISLPQSLRRAKPWFVAFLLCFSCAFGLRPAALGLPLGPQQGAGGRVVVLGFDGADARTLDQLIQQGELPNFAALRDSGTVAPLLSSTPPESPVAWASLNSGRNPSKTGVASFFVRGLDAYGKPYPTFGHLVDQQGDKGMPIQDLAHAPLPSAVLAWSQRQLGLVAGCAVALGFALLFLVLLRLRKPTALLLALLLGGVAGFGAWKARAYLPGRLPRYGNPMQAESFWNTAAEAGRRAVVLDVAQAFDEPEVEGVQALYGLGVPDAKGGLGEWCVYTTSEDELAPAPQGRGTGTAGKIFRVDERGGVITSQVVGPVNFWAKQRVEGEIERLRREEESVGVGFKRSLEINAQKQVFEEQLAELREQPLSAPLIARRVPGGWKIQLGEREQELKEGEWSDFYDLKFDLNPMLSVRAITRCKLVRAEAPFQLFLDVLHIDPSAPPFWQPISTPFAFSSDLARTAGAFETYGWACVTMPLKDREIDEQTFVEDIEFTLRWRERMTYAQLERDDWDLLMSVLSETDRVQHMLYHHYDPLHPLHDAAEAARSVRFCGRDVPLSRMIPEIYREADRVVGEVRARLQPSDTLLVCSDHGFQSFRTQVNLNNWLVERGYLALRPGLTPDAGNSTSTQGYADWSKTRAYAVGLGFVYVNEQGREGEGIVAPADKGALLDALEADLLAARDADGGKIWSAVYRPAELYDGAHGECLPDLIVGFAPPYHVSWSTGLGGLGLSESGSGLGPVFEPNRNPWSGDHTSMDLAAVRGIFASNRRFELPASGADLRHIAPTALQLLGVPVPADYDLAPLRVR